MHQMQWLSTVIGQGLLVCAAYWVQTERMHSDKRRLRLLLLNIESY